MPNNNRAKSSNKPTLEQEQIQQNESAADRKKIKIFNLDTDKPMLDPKTGIVRDLKLEIPISTETIDLLQESSHIFIVPTKEEEFGGRFYDVGNRFDIVSNDKERIFVAIETLETINASESKKKCCGKSVKQDFDIVILGSDGGEVMSIVKKSEVALITYKNETLGYLTQKDGFGSKFPTTYVISDEEGDLFQLHHLDDTRTGDFTISYMKDTSNNIGKITSLWSDLEGGKEKDYSNTFGVEIDEDMEIEHKALMIAALFTIFFKFYNANNRTCC